MNTWTSRRLVLTLLATTLMLVPAVPASAGWLGGYDYRQEVVVDPAVSPGNLTDFPLLVKITDQANHLFGNTTAADGQDIVFTTSDGVTPLSRDIEHFTAIGTKELNAWVKTNVSSTAPTRLYMYYNGPTSANSTATWNAYKMVQHLREDPSGTAPQMIDSTANGNNGTSAGAMASTQQIPGQVNGSLDFDGVNDFINCGSDVSLNTPDDYTIEMYVYNKAGGKSYPTLLNRAGQSGSNGFFWIYTLGTNESDLNFQYANGSGWSARGFAGALSKDQWQHVAFTYEGATKRLKCYVDGDQQGSTQTLTNALPVDDGNLYLGTYNGATTSYPFKGTLDEFRLSGTQRDADWIKATANNMGSPETYQATGPFHQQGTDVLKGYSYRQAITISKDATPVDLAAFPALIRITDAGNGLFANARSPSGYDVVFTRADGITRLEHDLECFSAAPGSEQLAAWVNTPLSSTEDTVIYMYYGSSAASEDPSSTAVWDGNYKMVQHLQEDPSGAAPQMKDSTQYGNHGTAAGGMTGANQVPGAVDGSLNLDGANDWVSCGSNSSLNMSGDYTIEMWVNNDGGAKSYPTLLNRAGQSGSNGFFWIYTRRADPTSVEFQYAGGGTSHYERFTGALNPANAWNHLAFTFDDATEELKLFVNGQQFGGTRTLTGALPVDDGTLYLATYGGLTSSYPWDGLLDEARLSDIARNPNWLLAGFNLMDPQGDFLSFAPQQAVPEPASLALLALGALCLAAVCRRRRKTV